jgi:hypothetical protein
MRAIVSCRDYKAATASLWKRTTDVLRESAPRFVCSACGKRGANVRPRHDPPKMGRLSARLLVRNATVGCALGYMDDEGEKKFLALTLSGIAALLIVLTVAAQAQLSRSALPITDVRSPEKVLSAQAMHEFACSIPAHRCTLP